jgi:hypothetical protein
MEYLTCDHCVLLNLPTLESIISYETGTTKFSRGYPRFVLHHNVSDLETALRGILLPSSSEDAQQEERVCTVALVGSITAARACADYCGAARIFDTSVILHALDAADSAAAVFLLNGAAAVASLTLTASSRLKEFLQHTGCRLSSRAAAAVLDAVSSAAQPTPSQEAVAASAHRIRQFVGDSLTGGIYNVTESDCKYADSVVLTSCGMSAFSTAFCALLLDACSRRDAGDRSHVTRRLVWVQLGWLYLDTTKVMERLNAAAVASVAPTSSSACDSSVAQPATLIEVFDVHDLRGLERVLADPVTGDRVGQLAFL